MKLGKKLSTKQFLISQLFIFIISVIFLGSLYYLFNIQYKKESKPFSVGPVTTAPKTLRLELGKPDDESLVFQNTIIISGQTSPLMEVLIFTDSQDLVITSKKDGSFSTILNLDEGVNKITASVFDSDGDSKTAERTIYYSKEKI